MNTDKLDVSSAALSKYGVSEPDKVRIAAVKTYDLAFVSNALNDDLIRTGRTYSCEQAYPLAARFGKADLRLALRLELEFKRFCILTLVKPGVPHAPSGAIDMYWHFFILHTVEYTDFCEKVWGDFKGDPRFRDHFPSTNETRRGMLDAYKITRDLYVDVFGEPEDYELDGIPGVADTVGVRPMWDRVSDTSGDSYSGVINPNEY